MPPRSHARGSSAAAKMRYVASYLLAALGGNTSPSAKDIQKIDPQPGDLAIKKRLIWIGRWVLGRDGMRGILKSLVST